MGIVRSLKKLNANIIIVEKDAKLVSILNDKGFEALINEDKDSIRQHLQNTFCVVTATSVVNCISDNFDKNDFNNVYLANMGPEDEYGYKFTAADVLFGKKPINFAADNPTEMCYLDPIFYAHNVAIDLLTSKKFTQGYHPFPDNLANEILEKWSIYHKLNMSTLSDPRYFYDEQSDKNT
jgi:adenosylhomocysteinase